MLYVQGVVGYLSDNMSRFLCISGRRCVGLDDLRLSAQLPSAHGIRALLYSGDRG